MKVDIITSKRGKKCSYCAATIGKGDKLIELTEWQPGTKFPDKKNLCFKCAEERVELIPKLELLLVQLKAYKRRMELITV